MNIPGLDRPRRWSSTSVFVRRSEGSTRRMQLHASKTPKQPLQAEACMRGDGPIQGCSINPQTLVKSKESKMEERCTRQDATSNYCVISLHCLEPLPPSWNLSPLFEQRKELLRDRKRREKRSWGGGYGRSSPGMFNNPLFRLSNRPY